MRRRYIQRRLGGRFFLTLSLALFLFLLAACGTNALTSTGAGGPGTTATTGAGESTPTATAGATKTPVQQPPAQNCGTVHTTRLLIVPTDQDRAQGIENCFWQAYQQCRPATMGYSQASLDTATIHNFSLKSQNGRCVITDALQHLIAPRAPQPAGSYTCASLTRQTDGLHFLACGKEGNILVPSAGAQ